MSPEAKTKKKDAAGNVAEEALGKKIRKRRRAMDMTRGFADVMDALPRPPLMVLGFDCILRRLALERAGMTAQMSDLLARYRVAGFNTYGEQHRGMHVNQTFVGMALMPPEAGQGAR